MMQYKGYLSKVEFDDLANVFHGEVVNIRDVITFQGRSVDELHEAFQASVEDYLAFCAERNEEPERPFSGQFMIRLSPEQHRRILASAQKAGMNTDMWIAETLVHAAGVDT